MHYFIGNLGHLFIIVSFISSLLGSYAWFQSEQAEFPEKEHWIKFAKAAFWTHALSVVAVVATLFIIIYNGYYEYHYAWSHSSKHLPAYYMISCFWEGQEGSFLLWIFWHAVLGLFLVFKNDRWQASTLSIFMLVQAFLTSMILGVVIPYLNIKIGSSPFILMRDALGASAPVFQMNPDYIPEDGRGLNPLLQNYWMVIHPPTLFLGFAGTMIPFAYAMAGLWKKDFEGWLKPALPWTLFTSAVLGLGILMGAYWAYETLNFGGYWNWDPVENAVYIPWLMLVASLHGMVSHRKSAPALRTSTILVILTFILILYATFLTRSGILGNASVHSFTDLGLSGQLLICLLAFLVLALALLIMRWKSIPTTTQEMKLYSREFWIFMGIMILGLSSFQVLVSTSIPVYNALFKAFGFNLEMAPPADPIAHYTVWQMWFTVAIAIVSAIGQYFWWTKMEKPADWNKFSAPLIMALLATTLVILLAKIDNASYIVVLLAGLFSFIANGFIIFRLIKQNTKLSGGAIAHAGVALMLIGVLFSSGYSKVISLNQSGLIYRKDFPEDMNRDNILLWYNKPMQMGEYELTYKGSRTELKNFQGYVDKNWLIPTEDPYQSILTNSIVVKDKTVFKKGDTVEVYPENTFYEIEYKTIAGKTFTLFPRAQVNPNMGLIASPDIKRSPFGDMYTHVSSIPPPDQEPEWSKPEEQIVAIGDTFFINDMVAVLTEVQRINEIDGIALEANDAAVKAIIRIFDQNQSYLAQPTFVIKDRMVGKIPYEVSGMGIWVSLVNINPESGKFSFEIKTSQREWVIMKAMEKPHINFLWGGSLVMLLGMGIAFKKRIQ
jgi:cytochrome c-type biogenesis protein CcmF